MKKSCGIYEIENNNGRLSYRIFAESDDLITFLKKNKDKKCHLMAPVFILPEYKEFPNTEIRKLSPEEIKRYMNER